jgi:hypothetical protein
MPKGSGEYQGLLDEYHRVIGVITPFPLSKYSCNGGDHVPLSLYPSS